MKNFWRFLFLYRRFIRLLVLFIVVVLFTTNFHKIPKGLIKISNAIEETERTVKFNLHSHTTVKVGENASIHSLANLRATTATGPLKVSKSNSRYFVDSTGKAVYLTGSHTWSNLQDSGLTNPPPKFDYTAYLDFLQENNHNFFRLWTWEQSGPWIGTIGDDYWFEPLPYQRLGPGIARDGQLKFDLTKFNQAYFDRLRQRVQEAGDRGIYVSVMLFNGWSVVERKGDMSSNNPWITHPFNKNNNINGIDGDLNGDNNGEETHTLSLPTVTAIQESYIRQVIDTINDLDNVLYEISNESHPGSKDWQYQMIDYIKSYEADKPKQHPVGMTVAFPECKSSWCSYFDNKQLFDSPADWISANGQAYSISSTLEITKPPIANGSKVILADTDHFCGNCGNSQWVWKSFTRGENPIFMDAYDNDFALPTALMGLVPPDSLNHEPWARLRPNLGYTLTYANRLNLLEMKPHSSLASTGYCLANQNSTNSEYLVYSPGDESVIVDLSATEGELAVEWFDPSNGTIIDGIKTTGGGYRSFVPPFPGDAVLYINRFN